MQIADKYGITVALIAYVVWDSRVREHKYIKIIGTLSEDVKQRLEKIEYKLFK